MHAMSVTTYRGGRIVRQRKNRLRRPEQVEERSRRMFAAFCEGLDTHELANLFGITERHVRRLLSRMPPRLRQEIRADVKRQRESRIEAMREQLYGSRVG
jgi:DNA-directed RNA polymerase specialized sigma subunit